jgi:hypothetical protein
MPMIRGGSVKLARIVRERIRNKTIEIIRIIERQASQPMKKNKLFLFVLTATFGLLQAQTAHAQQAFAFYGGVNPGTTSATRGTIYQVIPNSPTAPTSAVESVAFNLLTSSTFSSLTFSGTNGLSYDVASNRIYFAVTSGSGVDGRSNLLQGDLGVYWWERGTTNVGQLMSFSGLTTSDTDTSGNAITRQLNSDASFVYDGYYYFMQDQAVDSTPNIYRINLTGTPTLQTLENFNGVTNTRDYYDYGDIAVTTAGFVSGSAGDRRTASSGGTIVQWFFNGNASASGGGVGGAGSVLTFDSYSETTAATQTTLNPNYQLAYGWASSSANNTTLFGQSGSNNRFYKIDSSTGAQIGTSLFLGARSYSDLTSAAIPEPTSLVLFSLGFSGILLRRKRA